MVYLIVHCSHSNLYFTTASFIELPFFVYDAVTRPLLANRINLTEAQHGNIGSEEQVSICKGGLREEGFV